MLKDGWCMLMLHWLVHQFNHRRNIAQIYGGWLIFSSQSASSRWWVVHVEITRQKRFTWPWGTGDRMSASGIAAHRCTLAFAHAKVLAWRRSLKSQGWVKGLWNDDMYPSIGRWTMVNIPAKLSQTWCSMISLDIFGILLNTHTGLCSTSLASSTNFSSFLTPF